jgi:hypothetical protein
MQMKTWLLVSALGLAAVTGCGDDKKKSGGGGGGGEDDPPAGSNDALSELSDEEAQETCEALNTRFAKLNEPLARIECATISLASEECDDEEIETCVEEAEPSTEELPCEGVTADDLADGCEDTTAAEAFACIDAITDALSSAADELTCDADLGEIEESAPPAACTKIEDKCPTFSADFYAE